MKAFKELKHSTKVTIALIIGMISYICLTYLLFGVIKDYRVTFIVEMIMIGICWITYVIAMIKMIHAINTIEKRETKSR